MSARAILIVVMLVVSVVAILLWALLATIKETEQKMRYYNLKDRNNGNGRD